MNPKQIDILKQNLTIKDGQPVTTSLKVAESFDKEHKHVLEAIRDMGCSLEFCQLNFRQTVRFRPSPLNGAPIESPFYEITKDGFMFLAMGYTGQKAALLREGYIRAFNAMEHELRTGMAATREQLTFGLLQIVSDAARAGHNGSFIPSLMRYISMGLSQNEISRLLATPRRTIRNWMARLSTLGVRPVAAQQHKAQTIPRNNHQLYLFDPTCWQRAEV